MGTSRRGPGRRVWEHPVLVLAGEHDRVEPVDVLRRHLLRHLARARFEVIPASGHLLPLEAPRSVAAAPEDFAAGLALPGRERLAGSWTGVRWEDREYFVHPLHADVVSGDHCTGPFANGPGTGPRHDHDL
ncbi:alpha/beta fold hydrolase [Streptomyces sp. NBC_00096]|uniref:alpha/beta fold hydrolase n=1 Tax=Streptomyces sp. NBC_00096 TaxID=2975650 RepID=UPI003865F3D7